VEPPIPLRMPGSRWSLRGATCPQLSNRAREWSRAWSGLLGGGVIRTSVGPKGERARGAGDEAFGATGVGDA